MTETISDDERHSIDGSEVEHAGNGTHRFLRWGANLMVFAGLFTLANGLFMLYRTYFTAGFEAGVDTIDGLTRPELAATNSEVVSYIDHVHVNLAGTFLALGIAIAALAWFGVRHGRRWAWATAVALPLTFLPISLGVHTTVSFDYTTLTHLGPAGIGAPIFIVGAVLAYYGLRASEPIEPAGSSA